MLYEYYCENCDKVFEQNFKMGEAPKSVKCICGKTAGRDYGKTSFILQGGGWPSKGMKFNKEMTDRNTAAGKRMHKNRKGTELKTLAYDYGGGKVEGV